LKVRFFGLFTSDYLVFGLAEAEYPWTLVSLPYPKVSDTTLATLKAIAEEQGYDREQLFLVLQKER